MGGLGTLELNMGIWDAMLKIQEVVQLPGFEPMTFGLPDNAYENLHPMMYLDLPNESLESNALLAAFQTNVRATLGLFLVVHEEDMPESEGPYPRWICVTLAEAIRKIIEQANCDDSFANDGSVGSAVRVTSINSDYRPDRAVALLKVTLEVSAYQ